MHIIVLPAGIVVVAIWLYLVLARGMFWKVGSNTQFQNFAHQHGIRVAAVIPARNEADAIERALFSWLRQEFDGELRVFVIDDNSTDGTAQAARKASAQSSRASSVTVLGGATLPARWTGKLWAVSQGIEAARAWQPDYFLLTDADVVHGPRTLAGLVAKADHERLALVSLMVKLHCVSVPEKLLIPAFVYFFFMLYPPRWIADLRSHMAGAAGGCMLLRPDALDRAGGIASIRHEIIDDCALAQVIKQSGGAVSLELTSESASIRPYESFGEIGSMISRTAFNQLDHSLLLLLGTVVGLLITFLLPLGLLASGSPLAASMGVIALLLMVCSYLPMVRHHRLSPAWTLALPFAAIFYLGATVHSAIRYWTGRGGQWKGRAQDAT